MWQWKNFENRPVFDEVTHLRIDYGGLLFDPPTLWPVQCTPCLTGFRHVRGVWYNVQVYLNSDECCAVRAGDTLGVFNGVAVASQFYVGDGGVKLSTTDATDINITQSVTFDKLVFPYRISLAAAYDTGLSLSYFHGGDRPTCGLYNDKVCVCVCVISSHPV